MKILPPELQSHLDTGTTTLAWCWRLTRDDAAVLGFTDHDRDLAFDGTTFSAATGFTASQIKDGLGLSTDNLDVEGALSAAALSEDDLAGGVYDGARVEIWRVNWQDVQQRVLMRTGTLGDVARNGTAFTAEIRGLAQALQQPKGRLYQYACDADLGDARCTLDLSTTAYRAAGTVVSAQGTRVVVGALADIFAPDWFTRGRLTFTSGANQGRAQQIRRHSNVGDAVEIELWQPFAHAIAVDDGFILTTGCDKHFATCRDKFANAVNFRGFPHIPGSDALSAIARSGATTLTGT
jgi:uncharacterized phage protein (TIGR02218 family)